MRKNSPKRINHDRFTCYEKWSCKFMNVSKICRLTFMSSTIAISKSKSLKDTDRIVKSETMNNTTMRKILFLHIARSSTYLQFYRFLIIFLSLFLLLFLFFFFYWYKDLVGYALPALYRNRREWREFS